ncbi:hypothetical protein MFLAVUS_006525 [Mucor flavus]|uniref:Uncharacterized protein n=1 Tax=Mucor flavus TaxID=439312 RepID=A0ABP9Z1T4_9FUNG
MPIRKRSPYGPFVERVLLPSVRIGALLLAVLAIGFGSWLETNDNASSCSFKSSMSLHQVFLYRNISSNLTTPDSVSFGLWKHCYMYALNCSCTPTNLKYQPDVSTILQVATEHNAIPPLTSNTSLSRIIPLILATIFSCIAFLIGLWANRRGKYIYRKIVVGLLLATSILIAYGFGSTYDQYFRMIKQTCKSLNNNVYCARHAVQTEVIVFSMALILLFIGLIFWFIASSFFSVPIPEEEPKKHWSFRKDVPIKKRKNQFSSEQSLTTNNYHHQQLQHQQQDDLAVWRDVTMFDDNDHDELWPQKPDNTYDPYNNPAPSPKYRSNNNPHLRQQQKNVRSFHEQQQRSIGPNEKVSLTPTPPPVDAIAATTTRGNNNNKSRVTSNKNHHHQKRKESNDSALTFGGHSKSKRSHKPLSELEPTYKNTPTSISPHPFQYPPTTATTNDSKNSFCMTPYYEEQSPDSAYFQQQNSVPILSMPPVIEHPLNKKVVKDKRIQSYLQTQTPTASTSST